jgi:hypothetical protein
MNGNDNTRKRLNHLGIALVASLALLISNAAHADILATGGVYGGPNTSVVACYLFNAGTASITISTAQIVGELGPTYSGKPIVPGAGFDFNSCGIFPAILPAGATCGVATDNGSNQAWSCNFGMKGTGTAINTRGVMDIRASDSTVLINSNLR